MNSLSILGSTGSIGTQALEIVKSRKDLCVKALACACNIELLRKQIDEYKPECVAVYDKENAEELQANIDIPVHAGMDGLVQIAKHDSADTVLNSLVGSVGVLPTIAAIKEKKNIALANKETLVTAGNIVMNLVKRHEVSLKPIDSEHSAIFQCLQGERKADVKEIMLTCSGGSFRDHSLEQLQEVTVKEALNHPNWEMGQKITIDSATLMNKGFEVIEAHMLFGLSYDQIRVVIHPQSILHSLVEFKDTSMKAQLGLPDMKLPIQYSLSHPNRWPLKEKSLSLIEAGQFNFSKPDLIRFPCLGYAYDAGRQGGSMPCVLNAANEVCVKNFLEGTIPFMDIPKIIKDTMDTHSLLKAPDIDEILALDSKVKKELAQRIGA